MIERYSRPEMAGLWTLKFKFETWLKIEIFACEANAKLGLIPANALAQIKKKAEFNLDRIAEIEKEIHHDVIAFLTSVNEFVGESGRYIHFGLTSSDIGDTALAYTLKKALDIIIEGALKLKNSLRKKALEYKNTPCMGRSHGVHAEPTTFGLKMALFHEAVDRNITRLKNARKNISVGKLSGAVGTFSNIDISVEDYVCKKMGLYPAAIATQVLQRDRHAEVISAIAICASTLDQLATEIRALQKTEVREVEEPFRKGQKGSSAMPHKRNPILCERISGLSRVLKSNVQTAFDNVTLWHERDISHSSAERVILPDSTILLDYLLDKMVFIIDNLHIYPEQMLNNIHRTRGLIFSQKLLLYLIEKGFNREESYIIVQDNAMKVWNNQKLSLFEEILKDTRTRNLITKKELEKIFDLKPYLANIDFLFKRAGIE